MPRVLYVSFNSIDEPLVHSQVLSYLKGLQNKGWDFVLLTAENEKIRPEVEKYHLMMQELGINWQPVFRSKLGIIKQILAMVKLAQQTHGKRSLSLVHARSYYSGVVAYLFNRKTNVPYIYDIRGFWVDEKVYKGRLRKGAIFYNILKKIDYKIYSNAKGIVSLTKKGLGIIKTLPPFLGLSLPFVQVIPTCVNHQLFKNVSSDLRNIVYLGSIGDGYMGKVIFKVFQLVQKHYPEFSLTLISRSKTSLIQKLAKETGVDLDKLNCLTLKHQQVPSALQKGSIGLSFIQPHFSKQASCATKIGEYLACGMPVFCNSGIGDMDNVLTKDVSIIRDCFKSASLLSGLEEIIELSFKEKTPKHCSELAVRYFSLERGIEKYQELYVNLVKERM